MEEVPGLAFREKLLLKTEYNFSKKKNRLALATARYNAATTPEEKQIASTEHQKANAELYGVPDKNTFYALLAQKLDKIDTETLSTEDRQQYDELRQMLGELPTDIKPLYAPKQETIDRFGEMMRIFYEPFLKHIPEGQETFMAQDAADIFNRAINSEVGEETDWRAEVNPNAGLVSVSSSNKVIKFPGARNKGDYTRLELEKIIVHELGTHALRAMAYEDATIKAFRSESFDG